MISALAIPIMARIMINHIKLEFFPLHIIRGDIQKDILIFPFSIEIQDLGS